MRRRYKKLDRTQQELASCAGSSPVRSGCVLYAGEDITGRRSFELVRMGLAMVPEGRGVFGALTIEKNLAMGAYTRRDAAGIRADLERVFQLFPRLEERRQQTAGTLSGGEQQMLAIGRALMAAPKLILMDEPSMGLAPLAVEKIFQTVSQLPSRGITVLLVEQNARSALRIAHRGYVLEMAGRIVLEGSAEELLSNRDVQRAYLGGEARGPEGQPK